MQKLLLEGFVLEEDLRFVALGNRQILLIGTVTCHGNILIEVEKRLAVLSGDGPRALVQTEAYRYNAHAVGLGNIMRYENSDHRKYDHAHHYDVFSGDKEGTFRRIEEKNDVPTLADFINEVRDWYEANAERLEDL
jgi:hypothetical protein